MMPDTLTAPEIRLARSTALAGPVPEQDLRSLYRDSFPRVASKLAALGADRALAEDLFHDALVIYLEKQQAGTLVLRQDAGAYLGGVARFLYFKHLRQSPEQIPLDTLEWAAEVPDDFYPPAEQGTQSLMDSLRLAGSRCLELLQAFYYEQLSIPAIAARLGFKTAHATSVQKYKCLEKMRRELQKQDRHAQDFA